MTEIQTHLKRLKSDLLTQGSRVQDLALRAVESFFDADVAKAKGVEEDDSVIDRVDVEIERASISVLAAGVTDEHAIRFVVTIVKINNELERIADCAVTLAEAAQSPEAREGLGKIPNTVRVMANSVIGMVRDANRALDTLDVELAERVLAFDDTVDRFKREIFLGVERHVADGTFPVQLAFRLRTVTAALERMADHCTNICEQIIYLETGQTVRHLPEGWSKPTLPDF